jgi:hypothetical protein
VIVIPMAGLSSRFTNAGYRKPKFMLNAHGESLFWHCLNSFSFYFSKEKFLFIAKEGIETTKFIEEECTKLNIKNYQIVSLDAATRGQAETVYLGLKTVETMISESLTIFNIDTIRKNFRHPTFLNLEVDGYLEVFKGEGDHWSFIEPAANNNVTKTAEKKRISEFCSNGLYYFRSIDIYNDAFRKMLFEGEENWQGGELYIAPMYNYLIASKSVVKFQIINKDNLVFSGTPDEYESFINQEYKK